MKQVLYYSTSESVIVSPFITFWISPFALSTDSSSGIVTYALNFGIEYVVLFVPSPTTVYYLTSQPPPSESCIFMSADISPDSKSVDIIPSKLSIIPE